MSPSSARVAEQIGYTSVKVFHAGMPAWKKAGGVIVSQPEYIKSMIQNDASYILVDLREKAVAEKGHIPGAVSIPAGKISGSRNLFPEDKSAPIILYIDSGYDENAFKTVKSWGYKNLSLLENGVDAWVKSEGNLFAGDLSEIIDYVKKIPRGEIGIEEFEQIVKSHPADKLILDVRDADTAAGGILPGAVHIPLGEVEKRAAELPMDKEILIHCNTGIMASMAHETLTRKGYKVRFLNAVVQVDKDGVSEVSEK